MRLLFVSDDQGVSESVLERIFRESVFPFLPDIQEIGILNASPAELYAIKWARKLNIRYIGFLYNAESAVAFADWVCYVGKPSDSSAVVELCRQVKKPCQVFETKLAA